MLKDGPLANNAVGRERFFTDFHLQHFETLLLLALFFLFFLALMQRTEEYQLQVGSARSFIQFVTFFDVIAFQFGNHTIRHC